MSTSEPLLKSTDTCEYLDAGRNGEIITNSQLSLYDWPDNDPRLKHQEVRLLRSEDMDLIAEAARTHRFNFASFLRLYQNDPLPSQILEILNHRAFQFNSRTRFRQCSLMRNRIAAACEAQCPIEVILPAFCVISNPVKRLQQTVVTVAEEITLRHLGNISHIIEQIYAPGMTFHVISDSTFYALSFGVTAVESYNYIFLLRKHVKNLNLDKNIQIHDMSVLISEYMIPFQEHFDSWWRQFTSNPLVDGLSRAEYEQWLINMMASINTRQMNLTYKRMRDVFGPHVLSHSNDHVLSTIQEQARSALAIYRALKAAIAEMKWEDLFFPNAIRATIHTKSIPILGLRLYPEYKFSSTLLPYHGVAVLEYASKTRGHRMSIKPEMLVLGHQNITRVVNQDGVTLFYHKYAKS